MNIDELTPEQKIVYEFLSLATRAFEATNKSHPDWETIAETMHGCLSDSIEYTKRGDEENAKRAADAISDLFTSSRTVTFTFCAVVVPLEGCNHQGYKTNEPVVVVAPAERFAWRPYDNTRGGTICNFRAHIRPATDEEIISVAKAFVFDHKSSPSGGSSLLSFLGLK